ncbi:MAG: hypothetical protein PHV68_06705 [Candidatus Gastranaerophilales bacterium]|nr:hypothetical protein [Candidatus Gastranaerophilales bacterium]
MGCLKTIVSFIIVVLAVIGLNSLGGLDKVKEFINSKINPSPEKIEENAQKVADFSNISQEYTIIKTVEIAGVSAVVSENKITGQKIAFGDGSFLIKISKEDITSDKLDEKIKEIAPKLNFLPTRVQGIYIKEKGSFIADNQTIPYAKIKIDILSEKQSDLEGIIAVANVTDKKSKLIVAFNDEGKYDQKETENFVNSIKMYKF